MKLRERSAKRFWSGSRAARWVVFGTIAAIYVGNFVRVSLPIQGDGYYTWLWARSLAFDGDLHHKNDYALCGDPWTLSKPRAPGLGPQNQWNPGPAVVWVPMLWLGRLAHIGQHFDDPAVRGGCRGPIADFGVFGTVLMALAALWLCWRLARRYVGEGPALLATAGVALASPLPYYACRLPAYGHAPSAFAVALFFERWDATRGRSGIGRWLLLGGLLGLAMLMRPQNALVVVAPLMEWSYAFVRSAKRGDRRSVLRLLGYGFALVGMMLIIFSPQLYIWKITYGSFIAVPQGPYYMRWGHPSVDGVLFASTGGLLVWTPLLWLSFAGLLAAPARRSTRFIAVAFLIVLAATTYVNAAVWDYWGSMGFSNRRFTSMTLPFVFGLAVVFDALFRVAERWPRRVMAGAATMGIALFAVWNYAAMEGVGTQHIKSWREAPWEGTWNQIFAELTHSVYTTVGNPLAWPASIPFAVAHRTGLTRYDAMRGMGLFYAEYQNRAPRAGEERASLTDRLRSMYLVDGFAEPTDKVRGRRAVVTDASRARMLIPFFIGDVGAVSMEWTSVPPKPKPKPKSKPARLPPRGHQAAGRKPNRVRPHPPPYQRPRPIISRVTLLWDRKVIAQMDVPPRWTRTRIALPRGLVHAGVNEVTWKVAGPPVAMQFLEAVPLSETKAPLHPAHVHAKGAARRAVSESAPRRGR